MVKYASEELDHQTLTKVQQQLAHTLSGRSEEQVSALLRDLLGPKEYAALAKRLTAILLLLQGRSASETARVLKMSRAHANTLAHRLRAGEFTSITEQYTDVPAGWDDVTQFTENILRMGGLMPLYGESLGQVASGKNKQYRDKYQKGREARRVFRSDKTTDINDL